MMKFAKIAFADDPVRRPAGSNSAVFLAIAETVDCAGVGNVALCPVLPVLAVEVVPLPEMAFELHFEPLLKLPLEEDSHSAETWRDGCVNPFSHGSETCTCLRPLHRESRCLFGMHDVSRLDRINAAATLLAVVAIAVGAISVGLIALDP